MRMDVRKVIGLNARKARLARGLTQEQVAEKLGCDRAYISGLERGERNPTATTLWHLASALGLEPVELWKPPVNDNASHGTGRAGERKSSAPRTTRRLRSMA